ncbi:MAG: transporter [Pseudomonadota bacterium]|uniref:transporter n=1 Tax=Thermithiobacillus tepidarius TaxID=929 RepID=UPI0004245BB9|nr:transporter [Thermithiobacillus tepidarius]
MQRSPRHAIRLAALFTVFSACPTPVLAQSAPPAPADGQLQQEIASRDATIRDLLKRVEALEQKLNAANATAAASPTAASAAPAMAAAPAPAPAEADADVEAEAGGESGDRALEWALIREGGLLLAPWSLELEPGLSYAYRSTGTLFLAPDGTLIEAQNVLKRETLSSGLTTRLGLPWDTQLDLQIPYVIDDNRTVSFGPVQQKESESGLGDISIGLTKQLIRQKGWRPNLLASVLWKTTTGESALGPSPQSLSFVSLGSGFHAVQGALTAVKPQDPLVFFGTLSYTANLSDTKAGAEIDPGDAVGLKAGTILAANPDTSLRFALNLARIGETKRNGGTIPGSDYVSGLVELGISSVLSPKTLLDISAGIGLTNSSPDFVLSASLPVRLF